MHFLFIIISSPIDAYNIDRDNEGTDLRFRDKIIIGGVGFDSSSRLSYREYMLNRS